MTLTELSYYSRKMLPFFILIFLVLMILFYTTKILLVYQQTNKPKTSYTNPIFGKINKPIINEASNSAGFNYVFDTIAGVPQTATESAKVFFLPPGVTRFGYREKIYLIAKNLGFDTQVVKYKLNDKEAIFEDDKQKLTIDITNFNFSYEYRISSDEAFFTNTVIPAKTEIENKAIDFLKTLGRYPDELAQGKTNVIYHNYNQSNNILFVTATSEGANVVEVDFYRPNIEQFFIVTPKYFNSENFIIMIFNQDGFKVWKAQVQFFDKSEDQVGIYPLKSGDAAWEELKSGRGMVVSKDNNIKDVTIKEMFVAYLDQGSYQNYLQPVYVFLGKDKFVGYVPAIDNNYLVN